MISDIQSLLSELSAADGLRFQVRPSISEEDLKLRGPGDIVGTRQSGYFRLRIADIISDFELLKTAKQDAYDILKRDPRLLLPEHNVIRSVLLNAPPFFDKIFEGG